jgi:glycosyltransferase involved in cell wall biosynthesis
VAPDNSPRFRPLNVLWLIDHVCYDGSLHGGGRLFMNLMPEFDDRRVKIFPYFLRASKEVREVFAAAGHPAKTLDLGKFDPLSPFKIGALCREHDIDVMHLFCYAASTFGRMVGVAKGIPTVIHDFDTQVYYPYPLYLKVLDRVLAGSTGHALAASAVCKEYMRDVRKVPGDRIDVLYHAIPQEQLAVLSQLDRGSARAALKLGDEPVFCAVTKLGPERGNETLLAAFAEVLKSEPRAKLFIVYKPTLYHRLPKEYDGIDWVRKPDEMRARIEREIARLGLGGSVQMVESLERPETYYAACDVMVAPFENVRFSSVNLVEGMAYGRPHVVTGIGEPLELVERYGGGVTVPVGDVHGMARAMTRLVGDPALLASLSEKARRGAADLTVSAAADRLASLYESLHAARHGRTRAREATT